MTAAFGASDADGAWVWKDAYEAAEAALVLFIQRYGRAMRREAGAGPDGPAAMLGMVAGRLQPTPQDGARRGTWRSRLLPLDDSSWRRSSDGTDLPGHRGCAFALRTLAGGRSPLRANATKMAIWRD